MGQHPREVTSVGDPASFHIRFSAPVSFWTALASYSAAKARGLASGSLIIVRDGRCLAAFESQRS